MSSSLFLFSTYLSFVSILFYSYKNLIPHPEMWLNQAKTHLTLQEAKHHFISESLLKMDVGVVAKLNHCEKL